MNVNMKRYIKSSFTNGSCPYTKQQAIQIVRDYYGMTVREATQYVNNLQDYSIIKEMDAGLKGEARKAFYND